MVNSFIQTTNAWVLITAILALLLCLAIIWLFSDLELKFPGSERADLSVRKQLGKFYIACALTVVVAPVLLFNVESLRYWAGASCFLLSLVYLHRAWRCLGRSRAHSKIDPRDAAREVALVEESLSLHRKAKLVQCTKRLIQIMVIVVVYVYARGSAYFSLFDLCAFVFLLICLDLQFLTTGRELRKRLDWLQQSPTNPV